MHRRLSNNVGAMHHRLSNNVWTNDGRFHNNVWTNDGRFHNNVWTNDSRFNIQCWQNDGRLVEFTSLLYWVSPVCIALIKGGSYNRSIHLLYYLHSTLCLSVQLELHTDFPHSLGITPRNSTMTANQFGSNATKFSYLVPVSRHPSILRCGCFHCPQEERQVDKFNLFVVWRVPRNFKNDILRQIYLTTNKLTTTPICLKCH